MPVKEETIVGIGLTVISAFFAFMGLWAISLDLVFPFILDEIIALIAFVMAAMIEGAT